MPFAHIQTPKIPCTPPQVTKKPIIFANNAKFTNHFPIHTMVNGTLKIYSELHIIHPICLSLSRITQNLCYPC